MKRMKSMNEDQLREDLKAERDKNIFLLAGAGAGKSRLMVERILKQAQLKKDEDMFKHTVAITFTNKATMDLEEDVMEALLNLPEPATREHLLAQQHDLTIATIHSFCQQMLQARPLEAGLSPNFGLIEERETKELFNAILYDVFHHEFAQTDQGYEFMIENGFDISDYAAMLYSQALHYELGFKEATLSVDLDKEKAAAQAFLEEVIELVFEYQIPIKTSRSYKPLEILKHEKLKLPLRDFIIESYQNKEDIEEAIKTVTYVRQGGKELIEKLKPIYSREEWNKEKPIDTEEFADRIIAYIKELFESKVKQLLDENNLSIKTLFVDSKALEADIPYYKTWNEQLNKIMSETTEDNIERLYDHIFNQPLLFDELRSMLTDKNKDHYDTIDKSNVSELIELLTGDVYKKPALLSECREKLAVYRKKRHIHYTDSMQVKIILHRLFNQVIEKYEKEKLRRNVVTNNDLLMKTAQLLKNEDVREYFHEKYRYIYVDEYQDTDPLQTEILFYLTSETMPTSMEDAKPKAGSLFVVGDPKQSIYRFRNADLRIYNQMKEMAEKDENWRVENLYANFRSNNTLITWFNNTFSPLFETEEDLFVQPEYDAMSLKDEDKDDGWNQDLTGIYKLDSAGKNAEEQREYEAKRIASWVYEKCVHKKMCNFKDILIITPGNDDVVYYMDALKRHGIPTSFSGKVDMSEFPEIVRLAHLIDYFVRPNRLKKYRLLAHGFNISFSLYNDYENSEDDIKETEESFKNIRLVEEVLSHYRELAKKMRPMELLSTLVYDTRFGIYDTATTEINYQAARSVLTTLVERVRIYNPQTLADLAAYLIKQLDESIEYEVPADGDSNEVRIMNLHKTKGLEADIVILTSPKNPYTRMGKPTSIVTRHGWDEDIEYALYTKRGQGNASFKYFTESFSDKKQEELKHEEAERIRTIYVAATRAKQMLVITQSKARKNGTWDDLIDDDISELTISEEVEEIEVEQDIGYIPVNPVSPLSEEAVTSLEKWQSYHMLLPSDRGAYAKQEQADEAEEEISLEVATANENAPYKGPLWGNLVHAGIECLLKNPEQSFDEKMYHETLQKGLAQYDLTEKELHILGDVGVEDESTRQNILNQLAKNEALQTALTKYVEQFYQHNQFAHWLESYNVFPELPFTAWLSEVDATSLHLKESEEEQNKPVLVRGIIDLVLQAKQGDPTYLIIDYKTDRLLEDETVEVFKARLTKAYGQQLQTYKTILQKMSPKDSQIETYIYSVTLNEFIIC